MVLSFHKSVLRRRMFTACAAIFASVASLFAQAHYEGNIFIGGHGGVGFSKTFFNPSVKQKMPMGGVVGFTFRYIEENHFGIIGELNFEQRGWDENFEEFTQFSYRRTLNYIQIPVLAHIYFGNYRSHFFFNAGPEVGFMIGESTSSNFDYQNPASVSDFPINGRHTAQYTIEAPHKVDFGISASIGCEVFINSRHSLYLEGRFYYGLGNVIPTGRTEEFSSANSMSIMATVGYWFRLK